MGKNITRIVKACPSQNMGVVGEDHLNPVELRNHRSVVQREFDHYLFHGSSNVDRGGWLDGDRGVRSGGNGRLEGERRSQRIQNHGGDVEVARWHG